MLLMALSLVLGYNLYKLSNFDALYFKCQGLPVGWHSDFPRFLSYWHLNRSYLKNLKKLKLSKIP
jgi:hypothetical protein